MSAEDHAGQAVATLTQELAGLQAAANAAASAASHANGAVGQAQQAGFARVAEGLANLAGRIDKLSARLATAADQVTPGQQAAAEVTAQTTPTQAIDKLTVTIGAVDTAHAAITEAVQETGEVETETAQLLEGAQPGPLLGMLRDVRTAAADAAEQGAAAKEHAQAGIATGQQVGGGAGN